MDVEAATSGPAMSPVHAPDIEARPRHASTIEAGRSMAVFRMTGSTVCPAHVTTGSRRFVQIELEVSRPNLSRPPVHFDPEEARAGAGLEGGGIVCDDLVPTVGPEGRVVVGHTGKQASLTDGYGDRARRSGPTPPLFGHAHLSVHEPLQRSCGRPGDLASPGPKDVTRRGDPLRDESAPGAGS